MELVKGAALLLAVVVALNVAALGTAGHTAESADSGAADEPDLDQCIELLILEIGVQGHVDEGNLTDTWASVGTSCDADTVVVPPQEETPTPTPTATPTSTSTATPTATATATPTPTPTATATPTNHTATPTPTADDDSNTMADDDTNATATPIETETPEPVVAQTEDEEDNETSPAAAEDNDDTEEMPGFGPVVALVALLAAALLVARRNSMET